MKENKCNKKMKYFCTSEKKLDCQFYTAHNSNCCIFMGIDRSCNNMEAWKTAKLIKFSPKKGF